MAFFGVLAYLFFFFIRLQDWWGPLMGVPIDDIVIPIILIFLIPSFSKFIEILKLPQIRFLMLFIIAVVLSNLVNGYIDSAFDQGWRYLRYTIIFSAICLSVDSYPRLKWLAPYLIILITFIAWQGMIQAETGTNWAGKSLYWGNRIRWVGLFDGANITALVFVLVTPFLLEYLFSPWGKGYKLFSIINGYLLSIGFYLANSRGGFLSLIAVIFSFTSTRLEKKRGIVYAFILVVLLFGIAAPSRMGEIDDPEKSTRGRIHEWDESLQMIRYHNPFFGVGKGQFTNYTNLIAHNAFLQQLGETGLIGAFFWIGIIYVTILGMIKVLRKQAEMDTLNLSLYRGYFIGFIGILAGTLFISADNELVYIWMALCTSIILLENVELRVTLRDLKIIGLVEIIGIIGYYIATNLFKLIYF